MSYLRYTTNLYKSYQPELNRSLRSSSVPRHVPDIDQSRITRSSSQPPSSYYSYSSTSFAATPFRDKIRSVPRHVPYTHQRPYSTSSHYTDHDPRVLSYMARLDRQDVARGFVHHYRQERCVTPCGLGNNFYGTNKHSSDYLYPITADVLGSWKHYNLSANTLNTRNNRARSPIITRELGRYQGLDCRHYNYRQVPYYGSSDNFHYLAYGRRGL